MCTAHLRSALESFHICAMRVCDEHNVVIAIANTLIYPFLTHNMCVQRLRPNATDIIIEARENPINLAESIVISFMMH